MSDLKIDPDKLVSSLNFGGATRMLFTIHQDGRLELGPEVSADEAAAGFWKIVTGMQGTIYGDMRNALQLAHDAIERELSSTSELCWEGSLRSAALEAAAVLSRCTPQEVGVVSE